MKINQIRSLAIPDVKVIEFARFLDHRGYFAEPFRRSDLQNHPEAGVLQSADFVQVNESYSHSGTLRGLHFQWNPLMGKLVRTISGRMVDLVLDVRKGSPHFGKIIAFDMPARDEEAFGWWIWVPPGFAHGNFYLEPTRIEYFCTGQYSPGCEAGISPLAGDLDWSLCPPELKTLFDQTTAGPLNVSEKDQAGLTLTQWRDDPRSENFIFRQC
ncbi:MAG: dTDP-4-dehydrorhamnose 3,5-epimerase family protein [Pirellulales bacterium]|nr:dTDP-4-dehydrorhamnose 3,5-epimerase family protein [Pirellulales bacterium]